MNKPLTPNIVAFALNAVQSDMHIAREIPALTAVFLFVTETHDVVLAMQRLAEIVFNASVKNVRQSTRLKHLYAASIVGWIATARPRLGKCLKREQMPLHIKVHQQFRLMDMLP